MKRNFLAVSLAIISYALGTIEVTLAQQIVVGRTAFTVLKFSRLDTEDSYVYAEVSYQNAKDFCQRNLDGQTLKSCIRDTLQRVRPLTAKANCLSGTLETRGKNFEYIEVWDEILEKTRGTFKDTESGEILDFSSASGSPFLKNMMRFLCPSKTLS